MRGAFIIFLAVTSLAIGIYAALHARPQAAIWNAAAEHSLAMNKLVEREHQPDNPFCDHADCEIEHQVLREFDLPYKDRKAKLLITTSNDKVNDCHGCGPSLSFFEFTEHGREWVLTDTQFAVISWGQFGEAEKDGIRIAMLSDDVCGVFLDGGSMHQGIIEHFTNVVARVKNRWQPVTQIQTAENNQDGQELKGTDWKATVAVDPKGAGLHDLLVTSQGTMDGQKVDKVDRYRFNGTEYALVD